MVRLVWTVLGSSSTTVLQAVSVGTAVVLVRIAEVVHAPIVSLLLARIAEVVFGLAADSSAPPIAQLIVDSSSGLRIAESLLVHRVSESVHFAKVSTDSVQIAEISPVRFVEVRSESTCWKRTLEGGTVGSRAFQPVSESLQPVSQSPKSHSGRKYPSHLAFCYQSSSPDNNHNIFNLNKFCLFSTTTKKYEFSVQNLKTNHFQKLKTQKSF